MPSTRRPAARAPVPERPPVEGGRRARTYRHLVDEAMKLARNGSVASVSEVAAAAGVSRATAYRYFPSHSRLVEAIVDESLGPVRRFESREVAGEARIRDLFEQTFPRFKEFEPQLRAALQTALDHWARERSGTLDEEPFRRGNRRRILAHAAAPLRERLGAREYERLLKALSLVYGIEPYVVLKDMWHASNPEVDRIARWVAEAVIEKSLAEAAGAGRAGAAGRQRARATPDKP